jgi:hypothetical protein
MNWLSAILLVLVVVVWTAAVIVSTRRTSESSVASHPSPRLYDSGVDTDDVMLDLNASNPVPEQYQDKFEKEWCSWKCRKCRLTMKFQKSTPIKEIETRIQEHLKDDCPPKALCPSDR